jgi:hypothetical protein
LLFCIFLTTSKRNKKTLIQGSVFRFRVVDLIMQNHLSIDHWHKEPKIIWLSSSFSKDFNSMHPAAVCVHIIYFIAHNHGQQISTGKCFTSIALDCSSIFQIAKTLQIFCFLRSISGQNLSRAWTSMTSMSLDAENIKTQNIISVQLPKNLLIKHPLGSSIFSNNSALHEM